MTGRKAYVTASTASTTTWCGRRPTTPSRGSGHLIVRGDAPGITIIPTWDHLGLRASSTHDVVYDGVEAPEDHFLEIPFTGVYRDPAAQASALGLTHAALYVGVARAAQDFFTRFAHDRVPAGLGRPIATTDRIQTVAGEIEAQLVQAADTLLYGVTEKAVAGDATPSRAFPWRRS